MSAKIRLFVDGSLAAGKMLTLPEKQSHYLSHVMRMKTGSPVVVFNGQDGQWLAEIAVIEKKHVTLETVKQLARLQQLPDIWLAFAPIKMKTELVVEKAVELGVTKILPVTMQHSVVRSVNMEKLTAHAIEAAEQCERDAIPSIETCTDLPHMLGTWPQERLLLYADESGGGVPLKELLANLPKEPCAVLVGPEGGFSNDEKQMLRKRPFVKPFGMGPRILRADTAAVAALACLQAWCGDWDIAPSFRTAG